MTNHRKKKHFLIFCIAAFQLFEHQVNGKCAKINTLCFSQSTVLQKKSFGLKRKINTKNTEPILLSSSLDIPDVEYDKEEKISLEDIFGKGKGPHAAKKAKKHKSKYSKKEHALDPFEQQLVKSKEEEERRTKKRVEETREDLRQRLRSEGAKRERGAVEFPSEEDIDPYDPTTFGFVHVGEVLGAHGIKGEVKVRTNTDFGPERLYRPGIKHIQQPGRRYPREIELTSGRKQVDDIYLVKFKGVVNRELAQELRKHQVFVKQEEEVELDEGEFLVQELVGLKVYLAEDVSKLVGTIAGVILAEDLSSVPGMNDILEIEYEVEDDDPESYCLTKTMSCLVPFVKEVVPYVDIEEGRVMITPPAGLLELAVVKKEKVFVRGYLPAEAEGTKHLNPGQ